MSKKLWVLLIVSCGSFMATLDTSIVQVAAPTLSRFFGATFNSVQWINISYSLAVTLLLLPIGKFSDLIGSRTIYASGFLVFTIASFFCGLSPSIGWLVAARILQGAGAAMLMANGPALITQTFPKHQLGAALGILGISVSLGLITGPSFGGFLLGEWGWRSIFMVNCPIGLIGILLCFWKLRSKETKKIPISRGLNLDFWKIDFSLFKNSIFLWSNVSSLLIFVAYAAVFTLIPFFLEAIIQFLPGKSGLVQSVIPLSMLIVSPLSGRLSDKYGSRELCVAGALLFSCSLFWMGGLVSPGLVEDIGAEWIALGLAGIGAGLGLFQPPNNRAIMTVVPPQKLATASAILGTLRNLGLTLGPSLVTHIFEWQINLTGSFIASLHFTMLLSGSIGLFVVLASLSKTSQLKLR